jgi:hypothetical protein
MFRQHLSDQSRIYLMKNKGRMITILILSLFIGVLIAIYEGLAYCLTHYGAISFCVLSFIWLLRTISICSAMPGSFKFLQRDTTIRFNNDYCRNLSSMCEALIKSI